MAAMMNPPKPSDLTDKTWKHGATDGDIFVVIRDGSRGRRCERMDRDCSPSRSGTW